VSRAVCPGSFDPVTIGHLDVIGRAAELYDGVVVAVGSNISKNALFSPDERVALLRESCEQWPSVSVTLFSGLLVDFCAANDVDVIVKGLRSGADYDYELAMAQMNRKLTGVDTAFLPTAPQLAYVSSSLVREVASLGGDVSPFVTPAVLDQIAARLAERADH
jgi:pantetheine-phosphate adenylyltransferase